MTEHDQSHDESPPREFEAEARERLATLEVQQDNLEGKADELKDGQREILAQLGDLDDGFVTDEEFEPVKDSTEANTEVRTTAVAYAKLVGIAVGALGAAGTLLGAL